MTNSSSKNMKLISHNTLTGFGGIGEGVSLQVAKGGRRIMWLAHEGAPKNFTGVDVTDIKNTKVIPRETPYFSASKTITATYFSGAIETSS